VSLRVRIAAAAGAAVAVVVLIAAATTYLSVRSHLNGELNGELHARADALTPSLLARTGQPQPGAPRFGGRPFGGPGGAPAHVRPAPYGRAAGFVELVSAGGHVIVPGGQSAAPRQLPASATDRTIALHGGEKISERTVAGTRVRVLTRGVRGSGAVIIALPLTSLEKQLSQLLVTLALIAGGGIVLAALLGAFVARTALAPIDRFTRRIESLSDHVDLAARIDGEGRRDELGRLADVYNTTLDALEHAIDAQRQLIADASHELRTPIASLRANIQVLAEAERLPEDEQTALRRDIVDELDELTALVADVVELARGAEPEHGGQYVRLDEVVLGAVASARRRGDVDYATELEPTVVHGRPERIARAVSNLVDNARKWSPSAGTVEIALRGGELTIRDHGPGFAADDLPHVFDRFYRAPSARRMPGSGLGLAIVKQAAEAAGGWVRAANAPDGGAELTVSFGPAEPAAAPVGPPAATAHPSV
jgi:two-component system sensor histidine kinase MprB